MTDVEKLREKIAWREVNHRQLASRDVGTDLLRRLAERLEALEDFRTEVACGPHCELCPLEHPAYRSKWCHTCEADKLLADAPKEMTAEGEVSTPPMTIEVDTEYPTRTRLKIFLRGMKIGEIVVQNHDVAAVRARLTAPLAMKNKGSGDEI